MNIEIKREDLHKRLMYVLWCLDVGHDIKSCDSHQKYANWLKNETQVHMGDCTKDCCTCSRCMMMNLEIEAENIIGSIFGGGGIGWCGKECINNCEGAYDENGKQREKINSNP